MIRIGCDLDELNAFFKFRIDGFFDYVVFATSDTMKCFGCGREGHVKRACPEGANELDSEPRPSREITRENSSATATEDSAVGDDSSNAAGRNTERGEKGTDSVC